MNAALSPFVDTTAPRAASLVFWSATIMEVDPLDFLAAMREHLPEHDDLCRQPVKPHTALTRAIRRCQAGMPEGARWERIGTAEDEVVAAYIEEQYDVEAELGARVKSGDVLAVRVSTTGAFSVNSRMGLSDEQQEQVDRLRARYNKERGCLTHQDLTDVMKTILLERSQGIRVKTGGAVYLVPSPADDVVEGLTEVMKVANVEVVALPMYQPEVLGQFASPAKASLLDEAERIKARAEESLAKVQSYVQRAREAAEAGEPPPREPSAFMTVMADAKEMKAKAELYRDLLSVAIDDVEEATKAAQATVREAVRAMAQG